MPAGRRSSLSPEETPRPFAATAAAYAAAPGKVGREPPGSSDGCLCAAAGVRGGGGRGQGTRDACCLGRGVERLGCCPRRRASLVRAGAETEERRWGQGWEVSLVSSALTCPFSSNSLPGVTDCGEEHACALRAFLRGSPGNRGMDPCKDPLPARGQCQGSFTARVPLHPRLTWK